MATELENLVPEADVEVEGMRGPKGDKGDSYVLTEADKEEIAQKVDKIIDAETDKTLTLSGKPADAKAAGDEINDLKADLSEIATGLPEAQKTLLITILRNGLYSTDQSDNIDTLENLFFADIPATEVTLNASSISLIADSDEDTYALSATVRPVYSTDAVAWTSSNDMIATVSDAGLVTAVAFGTAIITATAGSVSATCNVVVTADEITSISAVYTQSGTVYNTDSLSDLTSDLVVTANYSGGGTQTIPSYDYSLSGTLTAGTSTITVTYGGFTDTFTVTVTERDLDTVVYENKSYRDIFMTANDLQGFDFENGVPQGCTVNTGSPVITDETYISASHSLKVFGTGSTQYKTANVSGVVNWATEAGTYFIAAKVKCDRYVKGNLGAVYGSNYSFFPATTAVTDGWVTKYSYSTQAAFTYDNNFIGSYSSANLDGYIDDVVKINLTALFDTVPSKNDILEWYETYCSLRNGGAS